MRPARYKPPFIGCQSFVQRVDEYGDSVAKAMLRGDYFKQVHYLLKLLCKKIMKNVGFTVLVQQSHLVHRRVPGQAIDWYNTLHPKNIIVPDILAHKYSISTKKNGSITVEAIFDNKSLRVNTNGT